MTSKQIIRFTANTPMGMSILYAVSPTIDEHAPSDRVYRFQSPNGQAKMKKKEPTAVRLAVLLGVWIQNDNIASLRS